MLSAQPPASPEKSLWRACGNAGRPLRKVAYKWYGPFAVNAATLVGMLKWPIVVVVVVGASAALVAFVGGALPDAPGQAPATPPSSSGPSASAPVTPGLAAGDANKPAAYPPGQSMTVSASPSSVAVGARLTATALKVKSGCKVKFSLGSNSVTVKSDSGKAVATLTAPSSAGTYPLLAATASCSTTASAFTNVIVAIPPAVRAPATVTHGVSFNITVSGFPANSQVAVTLIKSGVLVSKTVTTNGSGAGTVAVVLTKTGTYTVTATKGTVTAATTTKVL